MNTARELLVRGRFSLWALRPKCSGDWQGFWLLKSVPLFRAEAKNCPERRLLSRSANRVLWTLGPRSSKLAAP